MPAKILIGADLVPTKSNLELFQEGNILELIGEDLEALLSKCDFTIFNLEVPLVDTATPIKKAGPNLIAPINTIVGLKAINPNFFTLANNHILDQGDKGLFSTIDILKREGIAYAGVGENLDAASRAYIQKIDDIDIGIYCCAEHEFSIATENKPGANPFNPLESLDQISRLSEQCDRVIVLYHGGKEHYRYPSPNLRKVCRKIVEKGADLVVCQHSHCIGCKEEWKDGTIVYGQGNFLFDDCDNDFWNTGLLLELNKNFEIEYVPIVKKGNKVRMAIEEKNQILEDFYKRSEEIKDQNFVEQEYMKCAKSECLRYLKRMQGNRFQSLLFRIINKLSGHRFIKIMLSNQYSGNNKYGLINLLDCEVHRECLLYYLKNGYGEDDE